MHIKKQRLLTPGPTPVYPKALQAMLGADVHHRTEDFRNLYRAVLADLRTILGTRNEILLLSSSGTGAMEASVTNCFSPGDRVIICSAGKFGERWIELARAFQLDPVVVEAPYGQAVAPEALAQALQANPDARGVFVQASESSTGAAHDVQSMGRMVRTTDALFVVDAITGVGTMPLDIDAWELDIVIGGSQKALMIPPGLAFLSISSKAWDRMDRAVLPRYYFDLRIEKKNAARGESAWTPATSLILGLAEVLTYIKTLGMDRLIENAQHLAAATRAAAVALGLELFAPANPSGAVTAIQAPAGIDSSLIVRGLRDEFGSIIADGQGEMRGRLFRIAHLGYFDMADLFSLVAQMELILSRLGHRLVMGAGVTAVERYYLQHSAAKSLQSTMMGTSRKS